MPIRIDSRFLSVVVHDLRNPLNVIGLSLRMIEEEIPLEGSDEARQDLRIVRENVEQLTSMLSHLGDFARLVDDPAGPPAAATFDPRRLAEEAIEELGRPARSPGSAVRTEVRPGCPGSVTLDPVRSRTALRYALANAVASSGSAPIRLILDGADDRLRIEVAIDKPPRSTVASTGLAAEQFERLIGNEAERRGLDLALVARVSEILGGSARLEAREGSGSSIVLDWPRHPG